MKEKQNGNVEYDLGRETPTKELEMEEQLIRPRVFTRVASDDDDERKSGKRNCCHTFCFFVKLACQSIKRKKCQFVLGFLACFVVVLVTLVANTVLANGALIFFSTAEGNVG